MRGAAGLERAAGLAAAAVLAVVVVAPAVALVALAGLGKGGAGARADTVQLIGGPLESGGALMVLLRSAGWSLAAASLGALLGWCSARALAHVRSRALRAAVAVAMLLPIALPPWLLYAGYWLSVGPGTAVGDIIERRNMVSSFRVFALSLALVAWTAAPAFAVFLARGAHGSRSDARLLALDGAGWRIRLRAAWARDWRLLAASVLASAAFLLGETTAFDLAFVPTFGVELRSLDALGASAAQVLRAALPAIVLALAAIAAVAWLANNERARALRERPAGARMAADGPSGAGARASFGVLARAVLPVAVVFGPVALFARALANTPRFGDFLTLHGRALVSAIAVAACAGAIVAILAVALRTGLAARAGSAPRRVALACALLAALASLVPGTIVAVAVEAAYNHNATAFIYDTPAVVALVLAGRALAIAAIVALALDGREARSIRALRALDASGLVARAIALRAELALAGLAAFALALAWSLGELTASGRVIPPGFQWIATDILNAIHYQRPETVLFGVAALFGAGLVALAGVRTVLVAISRPAARGHLVAVAAALLATAVLPGCGDASTTQSTDASDAPTLAGQTGGAPGEFDAPVVESPLKVERVTGGAGRGPGQFNGPRVLAIAAATGETFVIDKDARVQRFDPSGAQIAEWRMPAFDRGKPTGASAAPDGSLVVADTHEHRILCFSPDGKILWTLGEYGMEPGQFIYPTDIAFAPDGRMFVSEYGSNDRIQVFDRERKFLYSFGANGVEPGQFLRPQAIVYDAERDELYVADVGNHRIQVFDSRGSLRRGFGRAGKGAGELAYPFGLAVEVDGRAIVAATGRPAGDANGPGRRTVVVAEHGNHRIQRLDAETGAPIGAAGGLGTAGGRLKYPWALEPAGIAPDGSQRYAVCDHANARIVYFTFPAGR